jgi:RNA polymerase sigma-70 factor, ECF subfamily
VDRPQVEALEARIWVAFGRGELDEAARRLVEGYGPLILGYLVRTMGSEPEAWEVFAQFSEDLLRGLPGFEGRSSFKTWAYRLATNARARYWKEPYRQRGRRLATDEMQHLEAEVRSRTHDYLRTEVKDRFAKLRERLDPEEQTLLTLRVDKDMGWAEIAEVLSGPDEACGERELAQRSAALRQKFQRLKAKIRKLAQEEGLLARREEGREE